MRSQASTWSFLIALLAGLTTAGVAVRGNWSNLMEGGASIEDRVERARNLAGRRLSQRFERAKVDYPPNALLFRAYKHEKRLEMWAGNGRGKLKLIHAYPIAGMSGTLGPKRKEGDKQVPEGLYHIDRFNPQSRFRLSLGINYPNASDRIRGDSKAPGGDIFIHGDTRSIGCLAMTDELIDEIYIAALDARSEGAGQIPVYIFPTVMDVGAIRRLSLQFPQHRTLWEELAIADRLFSRTHKPLRFSVTDTGAYNIRS
jgi:murein L,D-transpeptidase YafK